MVYSFNPQAHVFYDLSVMETLEAQAATVETVRGFCDGPIHVGSHHAVTPSPSDPQVNQQTSQAGCFRGFYPSPWSAALRGGDRAIWIATFLVARIRSTWARTSISVS